MYFFTLNRSRPFSKRFDHSLWSKSHNLQNVRHLKLSLMIENPCDMSFYTYFHQLYRSRSIRALRAESQVNTAKIQQFFTAESSGTKISAIDDQKIQKFAKSCLTFFRIVAEAENVTRWMSAQSDYNIYSLVSFSASATMLKKNQTRFSSEFINNTLLLISVKWD